MSTITTINSGDLITNSRAVINTNFSNLNTDKIETSVLDTDTTLSANSDSRIATQKAVKAYVDAGGVPTFNVYTVTGTTLSITTTASQKVIVWAKGDAYTGSGSSAGNAYLNYNAVQKDIAAFSNVSSTNSDSFAMMYTETPGAATHDITVTSDGNAGLRNVVIIAIILG